MMIFESVFPSRGVGVGSRDIACDVRSNLISSLDPH
jgi:hypothetical protein